MKIAVIGSRDFAALDLVRAEIDTFPRGTWVVTGGARGVDTVAEQHARALKLATLVFPANWDGEGRGAGLRRNNSIIGHADRVIAFWDGVSKGTAHSIGLAKSAEKPLVIILPTGERATYDYIDHGDQMEMFADAV